RHVRIVAVPPQGDAGADVVDVVVLPRLLLKQLGLDDLPARLGHGDEVPALPAAGQNGPGRIPELVEVVVTAWLRERRVEDRVLDDGWDGHGESGEGGRGARSVVPARQTRVSKIPRPSADRKKQRANVARKFRATLIQARKRTAEVPSPLTIAENRSQRL